MFEKKNLFPAESEKLRKMLSVSIDPCASLGEGAHGRVVRGHYGSMGVAVKLMSRESFSIYKSEVAALMRLWHHPHICRFLGTCTHNSDLGIVTELLGEDMFDALMREGRFGEARTRSVFCGVGQALAWMHHQGIVHCDLKLENIMLCADGTPKIIDLGLANRVCIGTPSYTAPEVFAKPPVSTPKRDVWSFAVCIFACLAGYFPFEEAHKGDWRFRRLLEARASGGVPSMCTFLYGLYRKECPFSVEAKRVLHACFALAHEERPAILVVMSDPWWSSACQAAAQK